MTKLRQIQLTLASALFFFLGVTGTAHSQYTATGGYQSVLLAGHNSLRAGAGLAPLQLNGQLSAAAQAKANDMVANDYWSHYSPSGASPWTFIDQSGYAYSSASENLSYGYATLDGVMSSWASSPVHMANIMNADFLDVGFGVANSANYIGQGPQTVIVAEYARPTYVSAPVPAPAVPATTRSAPSPSTASAAAAEPADNSQAPAPPATTPAKQTTQPAPAKNKTATKKQKSDQPAFLAKVESNVGEPPAAPAADQGVGLSVMGTAGTCLYGLWNRLFHSRLA
jgi:uncharacterized protein YkwD